MGASREGEGPRHRGREEARLRVSGHVLGAVVRVDATPGCWSRVPRVGGVGGVAGCGSPVPVPAAARRAGGQQRAHLPLLSRSASFSGN